MASEWLRKKIEEQKKSIDQYYDRYRECLYFGKLNEIEKEDVDLEYLKCDVYETIERDNNKGLRWTIFDGMGNIKNENTIDNEGNEICETLGVSLNYLKYGEMHRENIK